MSLATRLSICAALFALPIISTGCVQQEKYDSLLTAHRSTQEQLVVVEDERDSALASLRTTQEQLSQLRSAHDSLQTKYDGLRGEFDRLAGANDDYLNRIAHLEIGPLPPDISSAIEALARAHPELVTFDSRLGLLRFASDFTFDLGSAELQGTAATTLASLANILNEPTARNLEARVIGHTDNVRIGRPETRQQHPTNMHLSVHRAIAVRDGLVNSGLSPVRIQVAGYGEYRPIVPNGPRGAAENRRVEIYLAALPDLDALSDAQTQYPDPYIGSAPPAEEPMK